jgi:hypothetical protein
MGDSDIKSETGRGEDAPPMELASRIMRRGSEPLGMIDLRHPQQLYARTAGWVAQRFSLLDHWKTRYGNDEDSRAAQANLVFTSSGKASAESGALLSSHAQSPREMAQVSKPRSTMASPVAPAQPEKFRIRSHRESRESISRIATPSQVEQRSLPSPDSPAVKTNTPINPVNAPGSAAPEVIDMAQRVDRNRGYFSELPQRSPRGRSGVLGGERESRDTPPGAAEKNPAQQTGGYPLARRGAPAQPEMGEERTSASDREITQPLGNSPPASVTPPVRVMPLSRPVDTGESPSAPAPLVQRKDAKPVKVARARELTAPEISPPSTQIPLASPSTGIRQELPLPTAVEGATNRITSPVKTPAGQEETGVSPTAVNSPPSLPLVQRRSMGGVTATASRTGKDANPQTAIPGVTDQQAAATSEIRVASAIAPKPPLVWRTAVGPGIGAGVGGGDRSGSPSSINTAREMKVARQTDAAGSMPVTNTEIVTAAVKAPGAPPVNHHDVVQLAEQVSRILARQLAVECERRGRRGWS